MEEIDVIEKVEEPTDWVNRMVTIVKANGKFRICIDPHDLNKVGKHDYHPMSTIDEIVTRMPNAKVFSVLNASANQTRHAKHQTLYFQHFIWLIYVQMPPIWALNVSGNFPENYVREVSRYRRGRSCC